MTTLPLLRRNILLLFIRIYKFLYERKCVWKNNQSLRIKYDVQLTHFATKLTRSFLFYWINRNFPKLEYFYRNYIMKRNEIYYLLWLFYKVITGAQKKLSRIKLKIFLKNVKLSKSPISDNP